MSRRLPPDPDLDEIFDDDPQLERFAAILRSTQLREPPLDPAFRSGLRRRLLTQAFERSNRPQRGSWLSGLFRPPAFALGAAAVGAVLLGVFFVQLLNPAYPSTVVVTTDARPTAAIDPSRPITLSFNQPMDHRSVESSISIQPATQVSYTWQGNNLLIQPVGNQLAPNTQYHVTIAAAAATPKGQTLGEAKTILVLTAPAPSPQPQPSPSPSPQAPAITGEKQLASPAARVVGWSPDAKTLYYLAPNGDLDAIGADGSGSRTLHQQVSLAAVSPAGGVVFGSAGKVQAITPDGSLSLLDNAPADAIFFQGSKTLELRGANIYQAGGQAPVATITEPFKAAFPAPDGNHLIYRNAAGRTVLLNLNSPQVTAWNQSTSGTITWAPDSNHVAYVAGGGLQVTTPDGSSATQVASPVRDGAEVAWSAQDLLLVTMEPGLGAVHPDGSGFTQLSQEEYGGPVWAGSATSFAFLRQGALSSATVSSAGGSGLALNAGAKLVSDFMAARVKGDSTAALAFLNDSGKQAFSGGSRLLVTGDPRLARFYFVSSQVGPEGTPTLHYVVRLVLAKHSSEVAYLDETITVLRDPARGLLLIDSDSAGPQRDLGKGPTVLSVDVTKPGHVTVFLDSDLNSATVAGNVTLTGADGKPVSVQMVYANRAITVTASGLQAGEHYKLAVTSGLADINGQPLSAEYDLDFVAVG